MLESILILDLADEKGSFCSRLLADLGATVVKIEGPEGNLERRIGPFLRLLSGGADISLPFAYHNANKLGVLLDPGIPCGKRDFQKLVRKADVLIETCTSRHMGALDFDPQYLLRVNPGLILVSITGFGRSGPGRERHFCDSVGSASGGQMFLSGSSQGPPVKPPGLQSCYAASLFGAVSILLNLRKRRATGKGTYVDLSIQEAVASTLDHTMVDYFHDSRIAKRLGRHYQGRSFSVLRCKDGFIQIPILRSWETLLELMTSEGKAADLLQPEWQQKAYRQSHFDHILKVVERWTGSHSKRQLFELGQAMHFPWAPVVSPAEVPGCPQLIARRFFVPTPLPGGGLGIPMPGPPYRFSSFSSPPPKPAPSPGEHTSQILGDNGRKRIRTARRRQVPSIPERSILNGVRVVDLTRMLSGPLATRILADFGAEVIKVQSAITAQGGERNDTVPFSVWNRNKRSICLDLNQAAARDILLRLVSVSDVVAENYSPRVMANWGLTYERLREAKPDIIVASISAMGGGGPWKDYVGFAPTFHALSGLLSLMPPDGIRPMNLGLAYADAVAGLYAALGILSALEHREHAGEGQHIDLSAYEAVCTLLGPEYMKSAANALPRAGKALRGDHRWAGPDGCYPCKGEDRWCVIAIDGEKEWEAFCRISRIPGLMSQRFSTPAGRSKNRAEMDALIGRWTLRHTAGDVARRLQRAGIAAASVQNARDLAKDRHLASRRFFTSLEHPSLGTIVSDRSALWPWRRNPKGWKAAPLLGEDNQYVFVRLLGMSDEEVRSLSEKGIIH